MSAALVRQALEFVDPDETICKRGKKRAPRSAPPLLGTSGQVKKHHKQNFKKQNLDKKQQDKKATEEVVKKLLKLSQPTVDNKIAQKIVERAVKGKPLVDKIEVPNELQKSILFPDEDFDTFEEELFCS